MTQSLSIFINGGQMDNLEELQKFVKNKCEVLKKPVELQDILRALAKDLHNGIDRLTGILHIQFTNDESITAYDLHNAANDGSNKPVLKELFYWWLGASPQTLLDNDADPEDYGTIGFLEQSEKNQRAIAKLLGWGAK